MMIGTRSQASAISSPAKFKNVTDSPKKTRKNKSTTGSAPAVKKTKQKNGAALLRQHVKYECRGRVLLQKLLGKITETAGLLVCGHPPYALDTKLPSITPRFEQAPVSR